MVGDIYEDVFIYLDLAKDYLKKKDIIKSLKYFLEKKMETNPKSVYGILIFDNEGSPCFFTERENSEKLISSLENVWGSRSSSESYFEKGLFYILSYIAETIRKRSKSNRIIILTDTPSDLSEDYQKVLLDLVSKVKLFPTFIDIIRFSKEEKRFFKDDVKLNIIVSDTKGGIFYIRPDKNKLKATFEKLLKSKRLVNTFTDREDEVEISTEDLKFYSKLALELRDPENKENLKCYLCSHEICPICLDVYDIPKECPNCGVLFHSCCVLDYTTKNNIGIPFIFRCPQCDNLLKLKTEILEKKETIETKQINTPPQKSPIVNENIKNISNLKKISAPEPIKFKNMEGYKSQKIDEQLNSFPRDKEDVKIVRIGGYFGKKFKVKKIGNKTYYEKLSTNSSISNATNHKISPETKEDLIKMDEGMKSDKKKNRNTFWKPKLD